MFNDKEYFYKYYSPHSSKLVLANSSRKWSNPAEFNDPFDNQFDLNLHEDKQKMVIDLFNRGKEIIFNNAPFPKLIQPQLKAFIEIIKLALKGATLTPELNKKFEEEIMKGAEEGVERAIAIFQELIQKFRSALQNTLIFCLTENNDNLLMWAHYARDHTGTVIKFLSIPGGNSPLPLAQKVKYSKEMPRLDPFELSEGLTAEYVMNIFTLTKSIDWAYEQEWRIVSPPGTQNVSSGFFPFDPEELGAVYLGCKITEDDKKEIIETTSRKYPKAEIY